MQYRTLAGEQVSALGFGCMRLPLINNEPGKIDEKTAGQMLLTAYEQGVNYYDTAWMYHDNTSEDFLGKFLKEQGLREKIFLATKLPPVAGFMQEKADVEKIFTRQLAKLQTDYFDFYLLHALTRSGLKDFLHFDALNFIIRMKEEGKIRHLGFSFHDDRTLFQEIIDMYDWEFCQVQYNYMDTQFQAGTQGVQYAHSKGVDVIVMEPLRGGRLADRIPDFLKQKLQAVHKDRSMADWALSWLYNQKEVNLVLSGMSNMQHVEENIRIASSAQVGMLDDRELAVLADLQGELNRRLKVPCTACRYCMPCPQGINIPMLFTLYNDVFLYEQEKGAQGINNEQMPHIMYSLLDREEVASACIGCGECTTHCPQEIPIPEELEKVAELFKEEGPATG